MPRESGHRLAWEGDGKQFVPLSWLYTQFVVVPPDTGVGVRFGLVTPVVPRTEDD